MVSEWRMNVWKMGLITEPILGGTYRGLLAAELSDVPGVFLVDLANPIIRVSAFYVYDPLEDVYVLQQFINPPPTDSFPHGWDVILDH